MSQYFLSLFFENKSYEVDVRVSYSSKRNETHYFASHEEIVKRTNRPYILFMKSNTRFVFDFSNDDFIREIGKKIYEIDI